MLQLPSEPKAPFSYLGLLNDFNGVDVDQFSDRIVIKCETYIDRLLRSHGWSQPSKNDLDPSSDHACSPLPTNCIATLYSSQGFPENSAEHRHLVEKFGFAYCTLLGKLLYVYVTCCPDIGYAVITLSKFAACPSDYHFASLQKIAKYLCRTKSWGIHFHRSSENSLLPPYTGVSYHVEPNLLLFPELPSDCTLPGFIDATHANDLRNRRSTTGYAFLMAKGCVSYRCKTQPLTATSSTEAEFYAAVTAAKHAKYLCAILDELNLSQSLPTPLYCDNKSAINIVNA